MDFDIAPADDPRRMFVREWLAANPNPTGRQLAEAGLVVPHWPSPYGLDAGPDFQMVIDEELSAAGVSKPYNPIAIGWAAPTILMAGTEAQKQRYLWPALAGEERWCQLFSEPDSGSDLASLRTSAVLDGDEWVINGSKTWTSGGHQSAMGLLLVRTDPDAPKHRGITYFLCPMDAPGIEITPIIDMTGAHSFNQVFFDNVRLPTSSMVGEPGEGWRLAQVTLANERMSLSSGGVLWSTGPTVDDLIRLVVERGGTADPLLRQRLAKLWGEGEVLRLIRMSLLSARLNGGTPGPLASVQKLIADEHGQHVMDVAQATVGAQAMLSGAGPRGMLRPASSTATTEITTTRRDGIDPVWYYGWLFAPALTIGGGTWAVQRNILAERVLGLPREPDQTS